MKRLILPFVLACTLGATAQETTDTITAKPYYLLIGQAEEAISEDRLDEAATRLIEAMSVEPDNPGNVLLLSNLGVVYWRDGRDSLALETFDRVLEQAPSMVTVRLNRGRLHLDMGHSREAYDDFNDVVEQDSLNAGARYYRGTMNLYGGHLADAEADFNVLRALHPKAIDTAVALSTLYSLSGRNSEAIPYFERLVEDDPAPEFYAGLAGCLLAIENYSRASEVIADGLKRYSHDPELYYYRAWLNRDRYRLDDAHADARRAIDLGANKQKVEALFR
ncbi:MAG: tetratricopeptide repeat protein [Muribaculaceae bacterium]|nr:tetratricopeptide repeat protein [Muribaculaceae bacterium]